MARDCTVNKDPNAPISPPQPNGPPTRGGFDSEYASLMAELGEGGGASVDAPKTSWVGPAMGHDITGGGTNIPPWRRPEAWQQSGPPQNTGYRPPQPGYGGYAYNGGAWAGYNQGAGYSGQDYAAYYQGQYAQQQIS